MKYTLHSVIRKIESDQFKAEYRQCHVLAQFASKVLVIDNRTGPKVGFEVCERPKFVPSGQTQIINILLAKPESITDKMILTIWSLGEPGNNPNDQ